DLPTVYRSLLSGAEAIAPGNKARNDFEFVVASLRAARVGADDLPSADEPSGQRRDLLLAGVLKGMAQPMWGAASPAGWPERAEEWLSAVGLAQRLRWIPNVVQMIRDRTAEDFLERVLGPIATDRTRSVVKAASSREEGLALVLASPEFNRR